MLETKKLLIKHGINSDELIKLLNLRDEKKIDFLLVDVREEFEYKESHIKGVNMLKPTSSFNLWAKEIIDNYKEKVIIFTCRTDNRSGQVCKIFREYGLNVINHLGGIINYFGELE